MFVRRFLSSIFALCLISQHVAADTFGLFTFVVADNAVTITDYPDSAVGPVVIPAEINGLPVKRIGFGAFANCKSITSVTIPAGVTSIDVIAFQFCSSLTSVSMTDTVLGIGDSAFKSCTSLASVTLSGNLTSISSNMFESCTALTGIVIPATVTSIGGSAFRSCTALTGIVIPANVTSIGGNAFQLCGALATVTLPNSIHSIGTAAFAFCTSLTGITLPNALVAVPDSAFWGCTSLSSVTLPANLFAIGTSAFRGCSSLSSISIPNGVVTVHNLAFNGCSSLTSITIPASVTYLGDSAFLACYSLTSANIQANITEILSDTFSACGALTSVTLPAGITAIGDRAFSNCISLPAISLPSGLVSIAPWAFYSCTALTSVTLPAGFTTVGESAFQSCSAMTSVTLPNSVTSIGNYAFYECASLAAITLPSSGTSIGTGAFRECNSLTSVIIPGNITSFGDFVFYSCASLTSVTIQNGVTVIGNSAFEKCAALTTVALPNSVTSVGEAAFKDCTSLASLTLPGNLTSVASQLFYGCAALTGITIPGSVTSIGESAFFNCTSLAGISIPGNVTSIGQSAFSGCSALASLNIANGPTSIGSSAFLNCTVLTSVSLPNSLVSIGAFAFHSCTALPSISIPAGVTSIGQSAFNSCSSLASVALPAAITAIEDQVFRSCGSLTSIVIPNSVTSIGASAFRGCFKMTSVRWPENLVSIGEYAFESCSVLTDIVFPGSLTTIGASAFQFCKFGLTRITFPASVTAIGNSAFASCWSLNTAVFLGNAPTMGSNVFQSAHPNFKVSYMAGKTGFSSPWLGYPTEIAAPEITLEYPEGTGLADGDSASFGSLSVGTSGSIQTFTIRNLGVGDLTGLTISTTGDEGGFLVTQPPATTLAQGESTTFGVTFTPDATGTRTAAIHIASNDADESPYDITLEGTGTTAEIAVQQQQETGASDVVDGATVAFGSVPNGTSGSAKTFIIRNLGSSDLTGLAISITGHANSFLITQPPVTTLAPGGSTTFQVTFKPAATGLRTAAIQIASNDADENPYDIALEGTGTAAEIAVQQPNGTGFADVADGANIDFGSALLGTNGIVKNITIRNPGSADLTGLLITATGNTDSFIVTQPPVTTLASGGSTTFRVTFKPAAAGRRTAAIQIASNDVDENPYDIALEGTGTAAEIAVQQPNGTGFADVADGANIDFGSALLGTNGIVKNITVRNPGSADLTGLLITATGNTDSFIVTQPPVTTLVPGGSTTFQVTFKPAATGLRTAAIQIASNDADENPYDIALEGTGTAAEIAVQQPNGTGFADVADGAKIDFGSALLGTNGIVKNITISNPGSADLTGLFITATGNTDSFIITQPPVTTLVPGGSTTFRVTFKPKATRLRTAAIRIASNDVDETPYDITLEGTGLTPEIGVILGKKTNVADNSSTSFGSVKLGTKGVTKIYTVRNSGNSNLTGLKITTTGDKKSFLVKPLTKTTLAPGASNTFKVTFKPVARGKREATIRIASNDTDENHFDIRLNGVGLNSTRKSSPLFATAGDPGTASSKALKTIDAKDGLKYQTLVVFKSPAHAQPDWIVEVSPNLVDWYSGSRFTTLLTDDAVMLKVRDNTPMSAGSKRYIRLKAKP